MRDEFLGQRLTILLDRLSPPNAIKARPDLMQAEVSQLVGTVRHLAPSRGYESWWEDFEGALLARMTTRAWPIVSELRKAAAEIRTGKVEVTADVESRMVDMLADWLAKFGDQMPSMGRPTRTAALIERGALRDLAEARERGFDMTPEQSSEARRLANATIRDTGFGARRFGNA